MLPESPILRHSIKVASKTKAGRFVEADGTTPAPGSNALGPVYTDVDANDMVAVTVLGTASAIAGAAIAKGAALKVEADGKVITATNDTVTVARALTAAAAEDDDVLVLIIPN